MTRVRQAGIAVVLAPFAALSLLLWLTQTAGRFLHRRQPECCALCAHRIRVVATRVLLNGRMVLAHVKCARRGRLA